MTTRPDQERAYEELLRAVGAYLDREPHDRFTLLELLDGYTLVLQTGKKGGAAREIHIPRAGLEQQIKKLMRGRKRLGSKFMGKWRLSPTGHQDFLRALGFELDDAEAYEILLDELDDGLLVTYSYLDPTQGYQYRKRMTVLGSEQIEAVLQAAHARRAKRGLLKL